MKTLTDMLAELPPEDREKIEARARVLIDREKKRRAKRNLSYSTTNEPKRGY